MSKILYLKNLLNFFKLEITISKKSKLNIKDTDNNNNQSFKEIYSPSNENQFDQSILAKNFSKVGFSNIFDHIVR
ncbi:MAG: hypothetical protein R3E95_10325 [Thiolinea sp.]